MLERCSTDAPTLPLELCEMIIDFIAASSSAYVPSGFAPQYQLRQRHGDLVACALTCRAWAPRSLYHLSSRLLINRRVRLESMSIFLQTRPSRAAQIQLLYVCSPPRPYNPEDYDSFSRWSHLRLVPMRLAGLLTGLQRLMLIDLNWRGLHPSFFMLFTKFAPVTSLWMHQVYFDNAARLVSVLGALSSLRELTMVGVHFDDKAPEFHIRSGRAPRQPALSSVTIRSMPDTNLLIPWVLESRSSLKSLTLDIVQSTDALPAALLQLPVLRALSINFLLPKKGVDKMMGTLYSCCAHALTGRSTPLKAQLDLSRCEELEELSLRANQNYLSTLPKLLFTMPSNKLSRLILSLPSATIPEDDHSLIERWKSLDMFLSKFTHLRQVSFATSNSSGFSIARHLLPTLSQRGMLAFKIRDEAEEQYRSIRSTPLLPSGPKTLRHAT